MELTLTRPLFDEIITELELEAEKPQEAFSLRELVFTAYESITRIIKKKKGYKSVIEVFERKGFPIKAKTLQQYLFQCRSQHKQSSATGSTTSTKPATQTNSVIASLVDLPDSMDEDASLPTSTAVEVGVQASPDEVALGSSPAVDPSPIAIEDTQPAIAPENTVSSTSEAVATVASASEAEAEILSSSSAASPSVISEPTPATQPQSKSSKTAIAISPSSRSSSVVTTNSGTTPTVQPSNGSLSYVAKDDPEVAEYFSLFQRKK